MDQHGTYHSKEFCGAQKASSKAQGPLLRAEMEVSVLGLHLGHSTETHHGLKQVSGLFQMEGTVLGRPVSVRD